MRKLAVAVAVLGGILLTSCAKEEKLVPMVSFANEETLFFLQTISEETYKEALPWAHKGEENAMEIAKIYNLQENNEEQAQYWEQKLEQLHEQRIKEAPAKDSDLNDRLE
jgi:hypothetical protein